MRLRHLVDRSFSYLFRFPPTVVCSSSSLSLPVELLGCEPVSLPSDTVYPYRRIPTFRSGALLCSLATWEKFEDFSLTWPVTFVYPEHTTSDFIEKFAENVTMYEMLSMMFEERATWVGYLTGKCESWYLLIRKSFFLENNYLY